MPSPTDPNAFPDDDIYADDESADTTEGDEEHAPDALSSPSKPAFSSPSPAHDAQGLTKKGRRRRNRRTRRPAESGPRRYSGSERLLILDTWKRSGLGATDFAGVCGVPTHTLYAWNKRFREEGPAGLEDRPRGQGGSRLPEVTRRAILMLKEANPEWGSQRIHDVLLRTQAFTASPNAILRVLTEAGYEVSAPPSRRHPDKKRRFERARPNQLWQTDLFTFTLKRANRRVHMVAFLDDHSRFVVAYGLHASATTALTQEALLSGIARYGLPEEVLTDNGPQYVTWRGTSAFSRMLEAQGIKHLVARPRRPQTLGKVERFWSSLWQECLVSASLADLDGARALVDAFIAHYNFFRPHQGIDGLVPADRFFGADSTVRAELERRAGERAAALARGESPPASPPLYLTGRVGEQAVSLHADGDRLVVIGEGGTRHEIDLPGPAGEAAAGPGESPLDGVLRDLRERAGDEEARS